MWNNGAFESDTTFAQTLSVNKPCRPSTDLPLHCLFYSYINLSESFKYCTNCRKDIDNICNFTQCCRHRNENQTKMLKMEVSSALRAFFVVDSFIWRTKSNMSLWIPRRPDLIFEIKLIKDLDMYLDKRSLNITISNPKDYFRLHEFSHFTLLSQVHLYPLFRIHFWTLWWRWIKY